SEGHIIYVGKARSLRQRMRSYFQSPDKLHPKVRALMNRVADFDFIVTNSEVEALILERNLIKAYQPRYNIQLRDDKSYPYIKLTTKEKYPRLCLVREKKDGVSRYFGPYTDAGAVRETLRLLNGLFPLRTCKTLRPAERACLNFDIGRCKGPCKGMIGEEEYAIMVGQVLAFLEGDYKDLLRQKEEQMKIAAGRMEFELAAQLRDQINGIKKVQESQQVNFDKSYHLDIIAMVGGDKEKLVAVFKVRAGKVLTKDSYWLSRSVDEDDAGLMEYFIKFHYDDNPDVPGEILVSHLPAGQEVLETWLKDIAGHRVELHQPQRGERRRMLELAQNNGRLIWEEREQKNLQNQETLLHLSRVLSLEVIPERIEAYDISHLGGEETVASMVVFTGAVPDRKAYRRFKIKSDQNNDYASLAETLQRRWSQAEQGNQAFLPLPDLVLIDGGLGQVNAVKAALDDIGVEVPLCSLAKKDEVIFRPGVGEPLVFPRRDPALMLLQRMRDEAHRFAIEYNRQRRGKKITASALDGIEGIGPRRKQALLHHFTSVARIRQASQEELEQVPGMNRSAAEKVYRHFNP
ncbi:MAG: excinuclease ABC subunit UvrC, partial [Deltaproteobacteria bacterium]